MKIARTITMVLCIAAALIISGFVDISGGVSYSFIVQSVHREYFYYGMALLASAAFLIAGTVVACFKRVWVPLVCDIIGTACYIYTVSGLYSIPNSRVSKEQTEPLAERHLLTVIVTVLLLALVIFNFFDKKNMDKREKKRRLRHDREDRQLSDSEKII